jgi:diguanylate cyclase (GGDEF)-like protein
MATLARIAPRAARGPLALALWALLLGALVVVVATWVAGEITERREGDRIDSRLATNLRVGSEEFSDVLGDAQLRAERLAASERIQRALADGDQAEAARIARSEEGIGLVAGDTLLAGRDSWEASRAVDVLDDQGDSIGRVVVGVPLDEPLLDRLGRSAGLLDEDILAVAQGTQTLAASNDLEPGAVIPPADQGSAREGDETFRFVSTPLLEDTDVRLAALASDAPLQTAVDDTRRRAFLAALATVGLALLLGWTIAWAVRRTQGEAEAVKEVASDRRARDARTPADERRVREAVALVGEALAATHDPEALLPVILQSAIEATGAMGARLVSGGMEVVRAGKPEQGGKPLDLPLGSNEEGIGRLLLYPPKGGSFEGESEQLAHWLAAQASIAIENERLHRAVKRQAITDELTQLANRRRFTETLAVEVRRAERFGDPLTLVLADLDDFKKINDRYGHQTGDEVLRGFAEVLRENVRDFDLPARYGGEEFAVLLPETGLEGGEQLSRRLQAALLRLRIPEIGGDRAPVTASFGVSSFPAAGNSEELLADADAALYRAKAAGKNRVAAARG